MNQTRVKMVENVLLPLMIILNAVAVIFGPVQLANLILTNAQVKYSERSRSLITKTV